MRFKLFLITFLLIFFAIYAYSVDKKHTHFDKLMSNDWTHNNFLTRFFFSEWQYIKKIEGDKGFTALITIDPNNHPKWLAVTRIHRGIVDIYKTKTEFWFRESCNGEKTYPIKFENGISYSFVCNNNYLIDEVFAKGYKEIIFNRHGFKAKLEISDDIFDLLQRQTILNNDYLF